MPALLSVWLLLLLPCVGALPSLLALAVGGEFAWLSLLAGALFAWLGWFWLAEEVGELLLDWLRLGAALSLAERRGGGDSDAEGSRLEESGDLVLSTSDAKSLESCEASGRAGLGGALW